MSRKDRLMLWMMTNKLTVKIMSMPRLLKVLVAITTVIIAIVSIFKRKKAEAGEN